MSFVLRLLDIFISILVLIVLLPLLIIIIIIISIVDKSPPFYLQERIGRNGKIFKMFKLRTMVKGSDKALPLTTINDKRITSTGRLLRKYKLDEIPQLLNVIKGDMSLVGPRPEVKKYVNLYTPEQKKVLSIKPGVTDLASIYYAHENEILAKKKEPEEYYIKVILPHKIELNMEYIENRSVSSYFSILFNTLERLLKRRS